MVLYFLAVVIEKHAPIANLDGCKYYTTTLYIKKL